MTITTDALSELRGTKADRPIVPTSLRTEIRQFMEDCLVNVTGPHKINKGSVSKVMQCEGKFMAPDAFGWSPQAARGTIVHKATELYVGGLTDRSPSALAEASVMRIRRGGIDKNLADYFDALTSEEQAELLDEAAENISNFHTMFPPIPDSWNPAPEFSTSAWIGNPKRVILSGKIDLRLGSIDKLQPNRANMLLIDFKTGKPSASDFDDLRFYALIETLRIGVPPFRLANVYLSTGLITTEDYDEDVLWATVERVAEATLKIAGLRDGAFKPTLTPGPACLFCPIAAECKAAEA